jgi:hypothetical protein
MKFFQRFHKMFRTDEMTLTHLPVQTDQRSKEGLAAERTRKEKLAAAKAKHRKPFATEVRKERETKPSIVLSEIERKASADNRPTLIRVSK